MKKVILVLFALLSVGLASAFAQSASDTISVEKNRFYYKGMQIESIRQMKSIVANDQLALHFDRFNPYILGGGVAVAGLGVGLAAVANNHLKKGAFIYNSHLRSTASATPVEFSFGLVPGGVGFALSF